MEVYKDITYFHKKQCIVLKCRVKNLPEQIKALIQVNSKERPKYKISFPPLKSLLRFKICKFIL